MSTLYITPEFLTGYPSSVDWSIIPTVRATPAAQLAAQTDICQRATAFADAWCGMIMRATVNDEQETTGNGRLVVNPDTGNGQYRTRMSPVISVVSAWVSDAQLFPPQPNTLSAGYVRVQGQFNQSYPFPNASGMGPRSVEIAPGYITSSPPTLFNLQYVNGYPHCALTAEATAGATVLHVDEVCGYVATDSLGNTQTATGYIYDGTLTELATVSSVTAANGSTGNGASGPGTITLTTGTAFDHKAGVLFSCFPAEFLEAVAMVGIAMSMLRGSTAVVMASVSGGATNTSNSKAATYMEEAKARFKPYRLLR